MGGLFQGGWGGFFGGIGRIFRPLPASWGEFDLKVSPHRGGRFRGGLGGAFVPPPTPQDGGAFSGGIGGRSGVPSARGSPYRPPAARRGAPLRRGAVQPPLCTDPCKGRRRVPLSHFRHSCVPLRRSYVPFRHSCIPFRHSCAGRNPGDLVAASRPQRSDGLPERRSRAVERLKRERTSVVRLDSCLRRNDGINGPRGAGPLKNPPYAGGAGGVGAEYRVQDRVRADPPAARSGGPPA